MDAEVLTISWS